MIPIRRGLDALKRDLASVRNKGSFARNALYTFSDAAVNIGSQIILTPIVAHIYGPVAYGVYGLFTSIASNLTVLGGFGYPAAFVLPKEESKFFALVRLAFALLLGVTALSLPVFLFPSFLYSILPSWSVMGPWCMLIPWMALMVGATQMMANWNMRAKAFSTNAKVNSFTNISTRLLNMGTGFATQGAHWGLIFGDVLVRSLAAIWYLFGLRKHGLQDLFRKGSHTSLGSVALEYKEYPLYIFPGSWLSFFALQLPIFALSAIGDNKATGCFTLASSLLLMPLRLFGYSLSSVFIQKANELGNDTNALGILVRRMYARLRALGLVPFVSLVFFGDLIFKLILGPEWALAGAYCGVMGPLYLFRLLSEPISSVYNTQRKEKSLFMFNLTLFLVNVSAAVAGTWLFQDSRSIVLLFACCNALAYMFQSGAILARTGNNPWRSTATTLIAASMIALVMAAVRFLIVGSWWPSLNG
ncbi:MAG: lipopolysaccharide biosynthesis protein [Flavobacteriales bacterium]|nr:lipopolysaccharide biosynthesis protein [Flavobacteriales bacterium]